MLNTRGRVADALSAKGDAGLGKELFAVGLEIKRDTATEFLLDDFAEVGKIRDTSVDIGTYDAAVEFDVGLSFGDGEVRGSDAQSRDGKGSICRIDEDRDFLDLELLEGTGFDVEVYFSFGFVRKAFAFGGQFEGQSAIESGVAHQFGKVGLCELEFDIVALIEDACAGIESNGGLADAEFEVGFEIGKRALGSKEIGLDIGFDGVHGDDAFDIIGRDEEFARFDFHIEGRKILDGGVEVKGGALAKVEIELTCVEFCDLRLGAWIADRVHFEVKAEFAYFHVGIVEIEMQIFEVGEQGGTDHLEIS